MKTKKTQKQISKPKSKNYYKKKNQKLHTHSLLINYQFLSVSIDFHIVFENYSKDLVFDWLQLCVEYIRKLISYQYLVFQCKIMINLLFVKFVRKLFVQLID